MSLPVNITSASSLVPVFTKYTLSLPPSLDITFKVEAKPEDPWVAAVVVAAFSDSASRIAESTRLVMFLGFVAGAASRVAASSMQVIVCYASIWLRHKQVAFRSTRSATTFNLLILGIPTIASVSPDNDLHQAH
jgi:hypothetical protein